MKDKVFENKVLENYECEGQISIFDICPHEERRGCMSGEEKDPRNNTHKKSTGPVQPQ